MLTNINELVTPFLDKIKTNLSGTKYMSYLNIIETNLSNIISPFANELSEAHRSLTPKEIQIASLVKLGKSSKEIAQIFGVSVGTVMTHRNNIRKKLKLKSKNSNLRSHLLFHN
jgi:DNA-binding CsgD family transcriptional regulator